MNFSMKQSVDPSVKQKIHAQNLRQQLQTKFMDLCSLQTDWASQETSFNYKTENHANKLRQTQRAFDIEKNNDRARHIQFINQLNQEHHQMVISMQNQINSLIQQNQTEYLDNQDILDEIQNVNTQIAELQRLNLMDEEEEINETDSYAVIHELKAQLVQMQNQHTQLIQEKDLASKMQALQLEEMVKNQQKADDQYKNQHQLLIMRLNNLDRDQRTQIEQIGRQLKENKRHFSTTLQSIMNKCTNLQNEISDYQNNHANDMKMAINNQKKKKYDLKTCLARLRGSQEEAANAVKKYSEEKGKYTQLQQEVEELKADLMREQLEHDNLMKEVVQMDNEVISQMAKFVDESTFTFNRF